MLLVTPGALGSPQAAGDPSGWFRKSRNPFSCQLPVRTGRRSDRISEAEGTLGNCAAFFDGELQL